MPPSGYLYVNDTRYGMLPISYNITTTGAVFNPGWSENIWTYSGTKVFLGFSTTQGATQPDQQYAVGQSGTIGHAYENIYLYSVEGVQNETYITSDIDLTSVANAIRAKGGTSASLVYPVGYVSAINALPVSTLQSYKSVTYTNPGTATILPDSGYVGFEEISIEYSPSIYDGAYHGESLAGTTWYFNSWIYDEDEHWFRDNNWYYINFVSNESDFIILSTMDHVVMAYHNYPAGHQVTVYGDGWIDDGYRTISITGGTDATNSTLIAWLKANATRIS